MSKEGKRNREEKEIEEVKVDDLPVVLTCLFLGTDSDMCAGGGFYFDHRPQG